MGVELLRHEWLAVPAGAAGGFEHRPRRILVGKLLGYRAEPLTSAPGSP